MACFTPEERQSFNNFLSYGFCDTFRELYPGKIKYSFWDIRDKSRKENKGWRLDYAVVSKAILHNVVESEIHNDYWGSDHCPISVTMDSDSIVIDDFIKYMAIEEENKTALNKRADEESDEIKSDLEDLEDEPNMMEMMAKDVGSGQLEENEGTSALEAEFNEKIEKLGQKIKLGISDQKEVDKQSQSEKPSTTKNLVDEPVTDINPTDNLPEPSLSSSSDEYGNETMAAGPGAEPFEKEEFGENKAPNENDEEQEGF